MLWDGRSGLCQAAEGSIAVEGCGFCYREAGALVFVVRSNLSLFGSSTSRAVVPRTVNKFKSALNRQTKLEVK